MKYEVGDKVVVEIKNTTESRDDFYYKLAGIGIGGNWIGEKDILGKLEEFQPKQKKIVFTKAEKSEFDQLDIEEDDVLSLLNKIYYGDSQFLYLRLFGNDDVENKENQFEFVRAIEHPELIEVEKEKKYKLKLLGGYIAYDSLMHTYDYWTHEISKERIYHFKFTQSEIDKMQKLPKFQAINLEKCKEAVENENNEN